MTHISRNERGMALGLAILAIVIVGALIAGAVFAGTQEQRVAENQRRMEQSFGVAEAGVVEQIRTWNAGLLDTKQNYPHDSAVITLATTAGGTGSYLGTIFRMNDNIFLVDVTGSDKNSGAVGGSGIGGRQRLGIIAKLVPLELTAKGAIVTTGSVKLANYLVVNGNDSTPPGWTGCPPPGAAVPGIHVDSLSKIGAKPPTYIYGNPPTLSDGTVNDSTFSNYGSYTYSSLAAMADITLAAGAYAPMPLISGGVCQKTATNWGDPFNPTSACGNYFPIIHVQGNLDINTGAGVGGQGILLVDGDLHAKGPFTFIGYVFVQGNTKLQGTSAGDNHIIGTLVSGSKIGLKTKADTVDGTSNAFVGYSSCALQRVMKYRAVAALLRSRGWMQLY